MMHITHILYGPVYPTESVEEEEEEKGLFSSNETPPQPAELHQKNTNVNKLTSLI